MYPQGMKKYPLYPLCRLQYDVTNLMKVYVLLFDSVGMSRAKVNAKVCLPVGVFFSSEVCLGGITMSETHRVVLSLCEQVRH